MNEYEVIIEEITPCGGETYARKEIIEVEAESPEAYVHIEPEGTVVGRQRGAHQHRFIVLRPQESRTLCPLIEPDLSLRIGIAVVEKGIHGSDDSRAEDQQQRRRSQKGGRPAFMNLFQGRTSSNQKLE